MISARMLTAISSGVIAPMSRPAGGLGRAGCPAGAPPGGRGSPLAPPPLVAPPRPPDAPGGGGPSRRGRPPSSPGGARPPRVRARAAAPAHDAAVGPDQRLRARLRRGRPLAAHHGGEGEGLAPLA